MHAQDAVVPHRGEEVHGLPARERQQERGDGAHKQRDHRHDGVDLDQTLGLEVDPASRHGTGTIRRGDRRRREGDSGHGVPAWRMRAAPLSATARPVESTTITRPTIV